MLAQRLHDFLLFDIRANLFGFCGFLRQRIVAEHQHCASHLAHFVAALVPGDLEMVVARSQIAHHSAQPRQRTRYAHPRQRDGYAQPYRHRDQAVNQQHHRIALHACFDLGGTRVALFNTFVGGFGHGVGEVVELCAGCGKRHACFGEAPGIGEV